MSLYDKDFIPKMTIDTVQNKELYRPYPANTVEIKEMRKYYRN